MPAAGPVHTLQCRLANTLPVHSWHPGCSLPTLHTPLLPTAGTLLHPFTEQLMPCHCKSLDFMPASGAAVNGGLTTSPAHAADACSGLQHSQVRPLPHAHTLTLIITQVQQAAVHRRAS